MGPLGSGPSCYQRAIALFVVIDLVYGNRCWQQVPAILLGRWCGCFRSPDWMKHTRAIQPITRKTPLERQANILDGSLGSAEPVAGERRARIRELEEKPALLVAQPVSVPVQHFGNYREVLPKACRQC
jgi:hypothetical protein